MPLGRTQRCNSSNLPQGSFQSAQRCTSCGPPQPRGCTQYEEPSSTGQKLNKSTVRYTATTFSISPPNTPVGNELVQERWVIFSLSQTYLPHMQIFRCTGIKLYTMSCTCLYNNSINVCLYFLALYTPLQLLQVQLPIQVPHYFHHK